MYRFPKGPGWNSTHPTPSWGHPVLPDYGYDAIPYNTWNLCEVLFADIWEGCFQLLHFLVSLSSPVFFESMLPVQDHHILSHI